MVEQIEKLRFKPQIHLLAQRKYFRQIEIAPHKIRAAQRVAPQRSELAILRRVPARASARARIDARHKRTRIEPLHRPRLRDARNRSVLIQRHAGNLARKLRPAAIHDSLSVRRIGRAQHGERNPAVPKHRSRNLPAVERVPQQPPAHLDRQMINVLRVQIVPDIVIARTVIPRQFSRQRR